MKALANEDRVENERVLYLDLLRIFSIYGMMVLHVAASNWYITEVTSMEWQVFNFYGSLVRFCVPIFFMISGAIFLNDKRSLEIKKLYKKNILRLILASFFWSTMYYLVYQIIRWQATGEPLNIIDLIQCGITGHKYFWFIDVMVVLYMVTPILRIGSRNH